MKGRIFRVASRVIFGTVAAVALSLSGVRRSINTAFVERENGTARHRSSQQVRKSYQ